MIAATVAGIPDILGDKSCMAIRVAELARAGLTPDWTPGAAPHCVPIIVKQNQHGARGHHRRRHRANPRARPVSPGHVENSRHPGLPGHFLSPPATDRGREARL